MAILERPKDQREFIGVGHWWSRFFCGARNARMEYVPIHSENMFFAPQQPSNQIEIRTMQSTQRLPASRSMLGRFAPGMDRATGSRG